VGYRSFFQDALEGIAAYVMGRAPGDCGPALISAHTALEQFLHDVVAYEIVARTREGNLQQLVRCLEGMKFEQPRFQRPWKELTEAVKAGHPLTMEEVRPKVEKILNIGRARSLLEILLPGRKETPQWKELWDSLWEVSALRDNTVHRGQGPKVEDAIRVCEKIAEVFLSLPVSHLT